MIFPNTASEWQKWSNEHTASRANITNLQSYQPKLGGMREQKAGLIPPNVRSANWNEVMWKGYNQSDQLDTYLIPQHQQKELALFSRYILKDPNATGTPLLERAQKRFKEQSPRSIKHYQNTKKSPFNQGGVVFNVQQTMGDGVPLEKAESSELPYDPMYGANL
jgi:hypothetical protein